MSKNKYNSATVSNKPKISIIAAVSGNRAIGKNNKLLWRIPDDLKRFKKITTGHPVIMGRKTYESIGKPLRDRTNIVVTRNKTYRTRGIMVVNSLEKAIVLAKKTDKKEIFIIGGGQIYQQAIKFADNLYLTIVDGEFVADTFFPDYSQFDQVVFKKQGRYGKYKYTFLELKRSIKT